MRGRAGRIGFNRDVSDAPPPGLESIRLHDTRRRAVVPLEPLEPGKVGVYTCGPTVYAPQHLGNMRSQLFPDVLRRMLLASGLDVAYVTNITDVGHLTDDDHDAGDDKVEAAARREGRSAEEIAAHWTAQWAEDRRLLGCLDPDVLPTAAAHVPEQIAMVRTLEAGGHTYRIDDGVYFDVASFPRYAEFAGLDLDELEATGRVENVAHKRHPADFALWKLSPPGVRRLQEWDSPWGPGFPGWHIECSAMSIKYLGERFDIHTGGVDHIRVHHTNEVAQSESALGIHPWVSIWMHNEFLDLGGEKLSKSLGHTLGVGDLVARGIDPLAFRYFFLQAHYRQQQSFSFELLEAAATGYRRLVKHAVAARDAVGGDVTGGDPAVVDEPRRAFWSALADDLNAPQALAVASTVARRDDLAAADRWALLADFDRALGFGLAGAADPDAPATAASDPRIASLLAEREAAREARDFAAADRIRDELKAEGIEVVDTPAGPVARLT
ncbi:MAG: cysteinyl-tRNA synthetase [Acidimicrobiales bacterium]|nr:cysteinyl-tRNA synthetase [Acidimicrobiales bacterium]